MKKRWYLFMAVLLLVCILGVIMPEDTGDWGTLSASIDRADVAGMITATIFVVMMTP